MTGEEFRTLRTRLGLTQQQLSERLGVTVGAVSRWEAESRPISEQTARFLRVLVELGTKTPTKGRRPRRRR